MKPFEKNKTEGRMRKAALAVVLLGLMLPALTATATIDTYQNDSVVGVTIPPQFLPVIDATNFVNNNTFNITFTAPAPGFNAEIFESYNTINYTNNGLMVANSSYLTNSSGVLLNIAPGCGFLFDRYKTTHGQQLMAGSFYNAGTIRANSLIDILANAIFAGTLGKCTVNATNIVIPGTVELGIDGLMQLTGRNVDLTGGTLTLESINSFALTAQAQLNVLAATVGRQTNAIIPSSNFSLPNPSSGFFQGFNLTFGSLNLVNATAYVNDTGVVASNRFVRAVFISNQVPSVTNHVYFSFGDNIVEWVGAYTDPLTGLLATNYMYLEDFFGEVTNLQLNVGGGPVTYFWVQGGPFALGPAAPSGLPGGTFPNILLTNDFSYESVQFIPTSEPTNASAINPSGALTNLIGRIQITASRELDMTGVQITGPNYLSLTCTNQFDGAIGARIFAPYLDVNLGVTNGTLSISNLIEPSIPFWCGPVQVYSARWRLVDTFGVTNAFHVTLVNSQATPTSAPWVQNLTLHGTNLYISDVLNAFGAVSIDAQNLTITTNLDTGGVGSQNGELNLINPNTVWSTSLPNLRNLTNNGAIRVVNANPVNFGSAASPYNAFINHGLIADQGATVYAANFLSDGFITNSALGSFILKSQTATFTNGFLHAGGDVSITADSLLTSNLFLRASRSLTLTVTNQLSDTGPTNGSFWSVGLTSNGGVGSGFNLLRRPTSGDLLGTTINNYAPAGKTVINIWAGTNYGVTTQGYTNNAAIGRLILNALPGGIGTKFTFNGVGASNAIYVDYLELQNDATNRDQSGTGTNFVALNFNTNLVIYYAQAVMTGVSVAKKIDRWNSGHLRWVPQYNGYFSSTNMVYPGNVTNSINAALVQDSPALDSDGDGIINSSDPTPLFIVPTSENLQMIPTNGNTKMIFIWNSIPSATNKLVYSPDMLNWFVATNFVSPPTVPPVGGWPITNSVVTPYNGVIIYHQEPIVMPNTTSVYGPGF